MIIRGLEFPDDLCYHAAHMVWLRRDGADLFTLGLTPLAAASAGEILLFVPKAQGWAIERDRSVGNVETGKTVSSVRTPIAGVLVEVNSPLEYGAIKINHAPYDTWLVRLRATDWVHDQGNVAHGESAWSAIRAVMDEHGI
jgi:glycine cleavage system H protein